MPCAHRTRLYNITRSLLTPLIHAKEHVLNSHAQLTGHRDSDDYMYSDLHLEQNYWMRGGLRMNGHFTPQPCPAQLSSRSLCSLLASTQDTFRPPEHLSTPGSVSAPLAICKSDTHPSFDMLTCMNVRTITCATVN